MTFDEAQDNFRNNPSDISAKDYMDVAKDYHNDGMIGADTYVMAILEIEEYEAKS